MSYRKYLEWTFPFSLYKHHKNRNQRKAQANSAPSASSGCKLPHGDSRRRRQADTEHQGPCRFTRQVAAQSLHRHLDRRVVNFSQLFNHRYHHHAPCREQKNMSAGRTGLEGVGKGNRKTGSLRTQTETQNFPCFHP